MMSISNKAKVILPNDKRFHKQVEETTHKIFSSTSFFYKWISFYDLQKLRIKKDTHNALTKTLLWDSG